MKRHSGLILLLLVLFSVSISASAADLESVKPEFQVLTETTAFQNMGGVIILLNGESVAVNPADSILSEEFAIYAVGYAAQNEAGAFIPFQSDIMVSLSENTTVQKDISGGYPLFCGMT